ncbi:MAG: hypothetical protein ACPGJV_13870 [Bacteriovoracaceae bacterium]
MDKFLNLLILSVFLLGCQEEPPTELNCEKWARETYRGLPKAASLFDKHCKDKALKWSPKRCEEALGELILAKSKDYLVKKYGNEVFECYSQKDIEKFGGHLSPKTKKK